MMKEDKMRRVITVGYYADFSRFFSLIKIHTDNKKFEFLHVNLHLSGYVYSLVHKQKSIYLPWSAPNDDEKKMEAPADDDFYAKFIHYHKKLNPTLSTQKLILQAKRYYHYIAKLLDSYQPDLIILSGDSRMPVEIFNHLAHKKKIQVCFFEQAPLGRTIIDNAGVNANCSFRNINVNQIMNTKPVAYAPIKLSRWQGYKKYRLIDLVVETFFPRLQPVEHQRPARKKFDQDAYNALVKHKSFDLQKTQDERKKYLLILQVPDDVNMIYHSPWFSNHASIVAAVLASLPDNALLIVREHPLFKQLYEPALYQHISNNENIYLEQSSSLLSSLQRADVIVVNNSTVGLEAIQLSKPVVVLGDAYYDSTELCLKYNGTDLDKLLLAATQVRQDDPMFRDKYLSYLFNDVFIPGHFRDIDGPSPACIANWIIEHVD